MSKQSIILIALAGAFVGACKEPPSLVDRAAERVESAVGSAGPIAMAISAAMTAVNAVPDSAGSCATADVRCETFPCDATIDVQVGSACPLPLGEAASGNIQVSGSWSAAGQATFSSSFGDVRIDEDGHLLVIEASAVTAEDLGDVMKVAYAGATVRLAHGRHGLAEGSSWYITVAQNGTEDVTSDDRYTIDGGSSSSGISGTESIQLQGVIVDSTCRKNPIGGTAEVTIVVNERRFGWRVGVIEIAFHDACDGKADVISSVFAEDADSIDLDFTE